MLFGNDKRRSPVYTSRMQVPQPHLLLLNARVGVAMGLG
jgi:hypothetical protein